LFVVASAHNLMLRSARPGDKRRKCGVSSGRAKINAIGKTMARDR
jgi:hypothetical protein